MKKRFDVNASVGETLIEALKRAGLTVSAPCGGSGMCGGCAVKVEGAFSVPDDDEAVLLGSRLKRGYRLACRARTFGDFCVYLDDSRIGQDTIVGEKLTAVADIGTTVISVRIFENGSKKILREYSEPNRQMIYGSDVLTRICSSDDGHLDELTQTVRDQLSDMTVGADIDKCFCVGNTTMLCFLAGVDPSSIGIAPYDMPEAFGRWIGREKTGLRFDIYAGRCASSFVGADAVAAAIAAERSGLFEKGTVLCDLGTNGEIVLNTGDGYLCTATACGPAFEGVGLTCGGQAGDGAISHFWLDNGELKYSVIGEGKPDRICGSGIIDLCACLLKTGRIKPEGNMDAEFLAAPDVIFTPADVRKIQLAKSAVMTSLLMLEKHAGLKIKRIIVTGKLGENLNEELAKAIGLLPDGCEIVFMSELALEGAGLLCDNEGYAQDMIDRCTVVNFGGDELYTDMYIDNVSFSGAAEK